MTRLTKKVRIKLKDWIRPLYYLLRLNHNRYYWGTFFGISDERTVKIYGCNLRLLLRYRHELEYYLRAKRGMLICLDEIVAKNFVKQGDICLDVGANIGLTALLYVYSGASKVVAIEANPKMFDRLKEVASDSNSIEAWDLAASDCEGEITLFQSTAHNQGSTIDRDTISLFRHIFGSHPNSIVVKSNKLDKITQEDINFIKIDIEGAEVLALEGAKELLRKSSLRAVHIESYGNKISQVFDILIPIFSTVEQVVVSENGFDAKLVNYGSVVPKGYETTGNFVFSRS